MKVANDLPPRQIFGVQIVRRRVTNEQCLNPQLNLLWYCQYEKPFGNFRVVQKTQF